MMLLDIFNGIHLPSEDALFHFSAAPLPNHNHHRIAKDRHGNPILLLASNQIADTWHAPTINLENVAVTFNVKCVVRLNNQDLVKSFTTIAFHGNDETLKRYFLRLCEMLLSALGDTPSAQQIRQEISFFVELLQLASTPPRKTVQGLWAELFLITKSKNVELLVNCWHSNPEERFDFNSGDERLEVKSSSIALRIHSFSLDQLQSPANTKSIIASIILKQSAGGVSIDLLLSRIEERVQFNQELLQKIRTQIALTLGKLVMEASNFKFDYQLAEQSLRFYKSEDIPQISIEHVPPFVTDVKFNVDISSITPLTLEERHQYSLSQ